MAGHNCPIPDHLPHQSPNQPVWFGEVRGAAPLGSCLGGCLTGAPPWWGRGGLGSGTSGVPYLPCRGPKPSPGPAGSLRLAEQVMDRKGLEGLPGPPGLSDEVLWKLATAKEWEGRRCLSPGPPGPLTVLTGHLSWTQAPTETLSLSITGPLSEEAVLFDVSPQARGFV